MNIKPNIFPLKRKIKILYFTLKDLKSIKVKEYKNETKSLRD